MKKKTKALPLPVLGAIAATRGLLGTGVGLMLAPRLPQRKRKIVGLVLVAIGIASTVPLARIALGSK